MRYTIVGTKLGWMAIGGSEEGLSFLMLPQTTLEATLAKLGDLVEDAVEDAAAFGDLPLRLKRYFDGEGVVFLDRLDFAGATAFQRIVWDATRTIPYGEVRSYTWVAERIRRPQAYRAVGGALARNRFPIIVPCHRVMASNGSLGGFSGGLGLKQRLLDLEAVFG